MTENSPWKAPEQPAAQDTVPVFAGPVPPATPSAALPPAAEQPESGAIVARPRKANSYHLIRQRPFAALESLLKGRK